MTAALEGVSGQQHAPAALFPQERFGTHFTRGWVPGPVGRAENLVPTGIRSRTVQRVASRYTGGATRPTCVIYIYIYNTALYTKVKFTQ